MPSSSSPIILLQVLPHSTLLFHPLDQPGMERSRDIYPAIAQEVHRGDHLGDHSDILAGIERDDYPGHCDIQNRRFLPGQTGAVAVLRGFPILQLYHDFDALLLPNGPHPEERRDVDETDPTNLHVMGGELVAPADEHVIAPAGNLHHVISHEPMAAFYQIEDAFALADSGAPHKQQAHAIHIGKGTVECGSRGERLFHDGLDAAVELRSLEPAPENRDSVHPSE